MLGILKVRKEDCEVSGVRLSAKIPAILLIIEAQILKPYLRNI